MGESKSEDIAFLTPLTPRALEADGLRRPFGDSDPTADSASGGIVRQIPPAPVTPVVRLLVCEF